MSTVRWSCTGGVGRIELHRPERHNAVDLTMNAELASALDEIEARGAELRCVVIAGAGPSLSSGADLKMLGELSPADARRFMLDATWSFRRLERLPVPVLAAAKGYCLGGGFELVLHCDVVVAAEDAQFAFPEAALGLVTTAGSVARLIGAVGTLRARELLLGGRRVAAAEARAMGLVAEVVPAASLDERVEARSRAFVEKPREGLAAMKALARRVVEESLASSWIAEAEGFESLLRARARRGGE